MDADLGARAHSAHGLALGEDLGVGTNAHFKVLGPDALGHQYVFEAGCLWRARTHFGQVVANDAHHSVADLPGFGCVATGLFLDDPFQHGGDKSNAGSLDGLQVRRRHEPGQRGGACSSVAVGQNSGRVADALALMLAHGFGRARHVQQGRAGGGQLRQVKHAIFPHLDQRGAHALNPGATDQYGAGMVLGKCGRDIGHGR